jgi:diguanylate cyclase (GGDEF)-like protein/PAS domain S-box-containing protein
VVLARRITSPDGAFDGIVYAVIALEHFQDIFKSLDLGPSGVVSFRDPDLAMIVRYPEPTGPGSAVGNTTVSKEFVAALQRNPNAGVFSAPTGLDKIERTVSYRKVTHFPGYIIVGMATADYLAEWRGQVAKAAVMVALFLVITGASSWLIQSGWRRQAAAVAALERSNADLVKSEGALRASEERLRAMFDLSPLGMVRCTLDGRFIEANRAFLAIVGYDLDTLLTRTYHDLTPEAYRQTDAERIQQTGPDEKEYVRADGRLVPVRISALTIPGNDGEPFLWAIVEDISESRRAEAETLLAASVFHNTAEAIVITDTEARIISVNPAFTEITGYSPEEAIGQQPRLLKSDHHEAAFYQLMWHELTDRGQWKGRIWNRRKDGEAFLAWQTITAVRDERGTVVRYVSVFNDMTEVHRKDEHIRHQAYHDALTGLPNRLLLQDRLGHAVEIARRESERLAVMFIDLDRFKLVNDSLGHDVGDLLLIEVTNRLLGALRRSDTIARLGGDEFVVVVSAFDGVGEVAEVAEKIIASVVEPMEIKGHEVHVGASIGIALFPEDGDDHTTLMKGADTAMYRAKAAGRNTFRFYDPGMDGAAVERLNLEAALRHAIEDGEFRLYYQPKIALASGRLAGAEALIRWISPERGVVGPDVFIPVAEDTGLIVRIGDWVLSEACRQMAEWRRRGREVKVAVNVSARQFLDPLFADKVAAHLAQAGLEPSMLEIELTESTVMADPERAVTQLTQLRAVGVAVSVDDFGTGYSSLAYLKRLPLDTIKIDRSFVHQVDQDDENAAIVRAILGLGDALGMATIAEGVETAGEESHLQTSGCISAQGYRFAKPLPADEFEAWMAEAGQMP